jgi:hypothetical protein
MIDLNDFDIDCVVEYCDLLSSCCSSLNVAAASVYETAIDADEQA